MTRLNTPLGNRRGNKIRPRSVRPAPPISRLQRASSAPSAEVPTADLSGLAPDRPLLIRPTKLRFARNLKSQIKTKRHTNPRVYRWQTMEITIPMEIVEVTGLEAGMTMVIEGYRDGRIRMYPAGDVVSREERLI